MNLEEIFEYCINGKIQDINFKEYLVPSKGKQMPINPPTFAPKDKSDVSDYCISPLQDGKQTCIIDTEGSQANRMEPMFTREPYSKLIPQVIIQADDQQINLCDVPHRSADALLRNSTLYESHIKPAIQDLPRDYIKLAKFNPTAIVFGLWDSRNTGIKKRKMITTDIRAYNIDKLTRSGQYIPPVKYTKENLLGDKKDKKDHDTRSSLGFQDVPYNGPGGVIIYGNIIRNTQINTSTLRKITTPDKDVQTKLQKYIFGLSFVASTLQDGDLRHDCILCRDIDKGTPKYVTKQYNGSSQELDINQDDILQFAQQSAKEFGIGDDINGKFDVDMAKKELKDYKNKKE